MKLITLIVPAYNEAARICETVTEAFDYFGSIGQACEVIVSADGTDGTREAAQDLAQTNHGIRVIGSNERRGKGRGIRDAVRLASGDIIGFTDADNKTPITEFGKLEHALRMGHEVVIGSRAMRESHIERAQPFYRRLGSKGFAAFVHFSIGLSDIVDTQCGFKFFQGDVARDLFALQQIDGYMFDAEVLFLARLRGYHIEQIPIRWRDDGDSRWPPVSGSLRNGRDILSIRWRHRALAQPSETRREIAPPADG